MRVLALYDIHGNVEALDAVLADPATAGADAVLVGGDVVPGTFGRAALERLAALPVPVHRVRGNGEREVAAAVGAPAPDPAEDMALVTAALTAADLEPSAARALAEQPTTVELDGVLYCHATPRSDEEILTRESTPERYATALAGIDARLVVAGHTHQQDDRRVGDVRFVNAGSVGLPYEGDPAARWVLVVDGEPTLGRTAYDARGAGERMLATGWPDVPSTTAALLDPVAPGVVTELFESRARS